MLWREKQGKESTDIWSRDRSIPEMFIMTGNCPGPRCIYQDTEVSDGVWCLNHPEVGAASFAYSFNSSDLYRYLEARVEYVAHHDSRIIALESKRVLSYNCGLPVYVNRYAGVADLTIEHLRLILSGQLINWAEIGGFDCTIRVAMHGGKINYRVLGLALDSVGIRDLSSVECGPQSYEDLSQEVSRVPGTLAIGLRPGFQDESCSNLVSIEGANLLGSSAKSYPISSTFHIYSPQNKLGRGEMDFLYRLLQYRCFGRSSESLAA